MPRARRRLGAEVFLDDFGLRRLPNNDAEIIGGAARIAVLTGRAAVLVAGDYGNALPSCCSRSLSGPMRKPTPSPPQQQQVQQDFVQSMTIAGFILSPSAVTDEGGLAMSLRFTGGDTGVAQHDVQPLARLQHMTGSRCRGSCALGPWPLRCCLLCGRS